MFCSSDFLHKWTPCSPRLLRHSPLYQWKIKSAKCRSTFVKKGQPSVWDFKEHLEYIKDPQFRNYLGSGFVPPELEGPQIVDAQYTQIFGNITNFLTEYQTYSSTMHPLSGENLLFLLLHRFAETSGATVYTKIRRSEDVQVYDSIIAAPSEAVSLETYLSHDLGVVHAELTLDYMQDQRIEPTRRKLSSQQL
ncbi:hypothetical protein GQ44DRAFT_776090 [Phaeosphaeriaceae sp. PMI808]|nr:hypothetical protein GQ44DRAFT_776090 [Phaeosphaeriaceae sp. PMI808]